MSTCCACQTEPSPPQGASGEWFRLAVAGLVAGQAMIFGLAVNISPPPGSARWILHSVLAVSAVAVFLLAGLPILRTAFSALRRGRIVMEQLFLLGIAGAFGASLHSTITGYGHIYYEVVAVLGLEVDLGLRQNLETLADLGAAVGLGFLSWATAAFQLLGDLIERREEHEGIG